ncbi:FCS-Like Zinc finger 2-like [Bidens hawaiensis]|uniref:FCS-Like Zinc finger 2-like n=1 Tax=Bidens hawaiensis TaxID=980011 RepID=UPI00404A3E10
MNSTVVNHRHVSRSISLPHNFRSGMFREPQQYFLDACALCNKPLGCNRDIFMYKGDIPFCSVECREKQIEIDELKEKKQSLSASIKAMRKEEEREKSSASSSPKCPLRSGAVVAA